MNKPFSFQTTEVKHTTEAPKLDTKSLEDKIDALTKRIDALYDLVEKMKGIYK